ncbi:sarcocystatin-A-like [Eurosta solidaginis]|uniref:sarcocystatin-A-like n=1 Tax=Eurosta solidaginis TaxID=178769 RepID=UPI0035308EB4
MLSAKLFLLLSCLVSVALVQSKKVVNGVSTDEAKKSLIASLSKLAEGDAPCYEIEAVNTAKKETHLNMNVNLIDKKSRAKKNCNVDIWSRPWLKKGIQFTLDCPGGEVFMKDYSA